MHERFRATTKRGIFLLLLEPSISRKSTNKIPRLIYYSVSVISRIFLFFIIIVYLSSIRFAKTDIFNFIVQIIFFLKIGTFPFHF